VKPEEQPSAAFVVSDDRPAGEVLRFSHEAMASVFEVYCVHADAAYARQGAEAAFDVVDRIEQEQSRFIANSDVSRISDLVEGECARVSPWTMECLGIARHLYELTGRTFDVTLGSGWERLELDPEELTVRARQGGARLDLGGIGKGFAVDRMAELLLEWDITHVLVHGGFSSVRALEAPPEREGWLLRLTAPGSGRVLARISARDKAFGASGTQKGEHVRDPRTDGSDLAREAAWVAVAATGETQDDRSPATVADALSTAFMILPADQVADLCARYPELEAWLVPEPEAGGPTDQE
jgi:thiamine biosynthesis lipoprotein